MLLSQVGPQVAFEATLDFEFSQWESKRATVMEAMASKLGVSIEVVQVVSARPGSVLQFEVATSNSVTLSSAVVSMEQESGLTLGGISVSYVSPPVSLKVEGDQVLTLLPNSAPMSSAASVLLTSTTTSFSSSQFPVCTVNGVDVNTSFVSGSQVRCKFQTNAVTEHTAVIRT